MKILLIILFGISSFSAFTGEKANAKKARIDIGPTVHAPIAFKKNLYFLGTTGNLFKSDKAISKIKNIFHTDQTSVSDLTLDGDTLYFGDGLHDAKQTHLYHFSISKNKLLKKVSLKGHIQRPINFDNETIYVGHGPGGISAINKKDYSIKWNLNKISKKNIHVDSQILLLDDKACFNSIYTTKAFICVNKKTGKLISKIDFKESPKMMLSQVGDFIIGATTKADLLKSKFDIPSTLFFINSKTMKLDHKKELRGFNFFAPKKINDDEFFITISTGDLLTYSIKNKKITFVGEFPEPFISTPFMMGTDLCAIGIMGQLLCNEKGKTRYHVTKKKRHFDSPIGVIRQIDGKTYIPSRIGYLIL
jgi:hypothetical protein